jgi:hypothetical protein
VTILHPRRFAWLYGASTSSTVPTVPELPGQVVVSAGVPANLGAGTNEDNVAFSAQSPATSARPTT